MGNKLIFIIIGVVVVIGLVIGLGVAGIVPIPGLTKPKPKHSKAGTKADEAKAAEQAKADADAARKKAADDLQKLVADRDRLVKAGKWKEALPLAQQVTDALGKDKSSAPELDAATAVLSHVQTEADAAAAPKPDLDKGYTKLATVWAEIEPAKIVDILKKPNYTPETAAPILKLMDEDKVAAVLSLMEPNEAAAYSDALAKEASKLPPPTPTP